MKILVVQTGFFGDVVLTTPVFTNLRARYPKAEIFALTTKESRPLLEAHPALDGALVFDKRGAHSGWRGLRAMASELRALRFDLALSLHKSSRTALLLFLSGIPERIGFSNAGLPFLYHQRVRRSHLAHEALRNLVILEGCGANLDELDSRLSLGITNDAEDTAAGILREAGLDNKRLVGLAPGSVWATKRWTPGGFAAVGDELAERGFGVLLLGGPNDSEQGRAVEALMLQRPLNLIGRTGFMVSIALVAQLDILISNDSAPLHIASACGTPVVAAFCATVPEFGFGPWQVAHEVVGVESLSCRPCGRHGGESCPTGTHACQLGLHADQVLDAVYRVLETADRDERESVCI
ncbi:MAG: lipopolysaccharide heptosyltransferase II [Bdellovibrionota bacterium]